MNTIELRTRVGPDGILTLSIPIGISEANQEVKVVVESAQHGVETSARTSREEWERFVGATAGRWKGELERPEQGEFEVRDQWP
ncbi:MAG: hypothetical protein ACLQGP_20470 [Isosphaeraceae bacterium]